MKPKLIVGNWKMDPPSADEAAEIALSVSEGMKKSKKATVVVCPPFPHLGIANEAAGKYLVGAQDMFAEAKGSFTGAVSADMLKSYGVSHVIVGHSERRAMGETDEAINAKLATALKAKLVPILCVGERVRDTEGHYLAEIRSQIERGLKGVNRRALANLAIAYEPVWAIGAAEAMGAREVHETVLYIKKVLVDLYHVRGPVPTPILYGGAVDPSNARALLTDGTADGLLIGRQSRDPSAFLEIISIAQSI